MLKYLIYTKGQLTWHRWGTWVESLTTVKKRLLVGLQRGLSPEDSILVLESKSPCECVYRLKKFVDGKWYNSSYIDVFQDFYAPAVYKYVELHIKEYINYRFSQERDFGDTPSMLEWATRNDQAIRCLIFWLYDNDYVTIKGV